MVSRMKKNKDKDRSGNNMENGDNEGIDKTAEEDGQRDVEFESQEFSQQSTETAVPSTKDVSGADPSSKNPASSANGNPPMGLTNHEADGQEFHSERGTIEEEEEDDDNQNHLGHEVRIKIEDTDDDFDAILRYSPPPAAAASEASEAPGTRQGQQGQEENNEHNDGDRQDTERDQQEQNDDQEDDDHHSQKNQNEVEMAEVEIEDVEEEYEGDASDEVEEEKIKTRPKSSRIARAAKRAALKTTASIDDSDSDIEPSKVAAKKPKRTMTAKKRTTTKQAAKKIASTSPGFEKRPKRTIRRTRNPKRTRVESGDENSSTTSPATSKAERTSRPSRPSRSAKTSAREKVALINKSENTKYEFEKEYFDWESDLNKKIRKHSTYSDDSNDHGQTGNDDNKGKEKSERKTNGENTTSTALSSSPGAVVANSDKKKRKVNLPKVCKKRKGPPKPVRHPPKGHAIATESTADGGSNDTVETTATTAVEDDAVIADPSSPPPSPQGKPGKKVRRQLTTTRSNRSSPGKVAQNEKNSSISLPGNAVANADPDVGGEINTNISSIDDGNADDSQEKYICPPVPAQVSPNSDNWRDIRIQLTDEKVPYQYRDDPNEYYIEEEAHLYHNPPLRGIYNRNGQSIDIGVVHSNDIKKIPPPEPLPDFPSTGYCRWTYDEINRVVMANFWYDDNDDESIGTNAKGGKKKKRLSSAGCMHPQDEEFLLQLFERNDITVITDGFIDWQQSQSDTIDNNDCTRKRKVKGRRLKRKKKDNNHLWALDYMSGVQGTEYYHKFRRFDMVIAPAASDPASQQKEGAAKGSGKKKRKRSNNYKNTEKNDSEEKLSTTTPPPTTPTQMTSLTKLSTPTKEDGGNDSSNDSSKIAGDVDNGVPVVERICIEKDVLYSMKFNDYLNYLKQRRDFLKEQEDPVLLRQQQPNKKQEKELTTKTKPNQSSSSSEQEHDDSRSDKVHHPTEKPSSSSSSPLSSESMNMGESKDKETTDTEKQEGSHGDERMDDKDDQTTSGASSSKLHEDGIGWVKGGNVPPYFKFTDHNGLIQQVHVGNTALYMIDLDVKKLFPFVHEDFMEHFQYPEVLPGGKHCMMNSVTESARPFMGPNMYITPPASFTAFHQDGHGTVDSGHLCIRGYNEVIMLRRLTERHKQHALYLLTGNKKGKSDGLDYFDGLYSEPHGDLLGAKPKWPTKEKIDECRKMGYCPSVLILKPGQMIHINKGRLHAFRKMATAPLPSDDCHSKLRASLIEKEGIKGEQLCISIAWDWMYRGVTPAGTNREVCTVLEASILNRLNEKMSLAIPELSLLEMARNIPALIDSERMLHGKDNGGHHNRNLIRLVPPGESHSSSTCDADISGSNNDGREENNNNDDDDDDNDGNGLEPFEAPKMDMLKGILPGLRHVVHQHLTAMKRPPGASAAATARHLRVSLAKRPNSQEDPSTFAVDPYGNNDFICKICQKELSNVYFHCDGCEKILSKDFNICQKCHTEKRYARKILMHPNNPKRHCTINHTGDMHLDRASRCPCKNGPVCRFCGYCQGCSCRCHTWFTLNYRFHDEGGEKALLKRVEDLAEPSPATPPSSSSSEPISTDARPTEAETSEEMATTSTTTERKTKAEIEQLYLQDQAYTEVRLEMASRLFHRQQFCFLPQPKSLLSSTL